MNSFYLILYDLKKFIVVLISFFYLNLSAQEADTSILYERRTFVRMSFVIVPSISVEREINERFSILAGVGTGLYVKQEKFITTDGFVNGMGTAEIVYLPEPLLRLYYPARVAVLSEKEESLNQNIYYGDVVYEFKPYLDLEGRYYVNQKRREEIGKSTLNKSANYINVMGGYYFDGLKLFRINYGIQRNQKNTWIDWNIGLAYSSGEYESGVFINGLLRLGIRFFKFNGKKQNAVL